MNKQFFVISGALCAYVVHKNLVLSSDDLAKKYTENIESSLLNNNPGKIRMELKFLFPPSK